jgi:phosphohistidine phosphatase
MTPTLAAGSRIAAVRVIVVRHAEAAPGEPDSLRALTAAGRAQSRQLGKRLATAGVGSVVSSPLLRARETAAEIARAAGVEAEVDELLAPGATSAGLLACVADRAEPVVVVGHEPDCGRIVAELTNREPLSFAPAESAELEI